MYTCIDLHVVVVNRWEEKNILLLSQYSNHCSMHCLRCRVSLIARCIHVCTWTLSDPLPKHVTLMTPYHTLYMYIHVPLL